MIDSLLMSHVHKDLVYRRVPLAEDENGLTLLRAANEAVVNEDDEIGYVYFAEEDCECGLADCLACNYDYVTVLKKLARVLEKNSRCLDLYLGRLRHDGKYGMIGEGAARRSAEVAGVGKARWSRRSCHVEYQVRSYRRTLC